MCSDHILLGLVCEDSQSRNGYLNSGLTLEKLRDRLGEGKKRAVLSGESIPFSKEVRRVFEHATNVSLVW